ncbi:MAG: hypothetical protein BGN85_08675 [Alphaproteobacteria bacterium 64-11]|nr:MAG: hypothetical protein BGN85_08675 [Alphaproteobacteria bacterium 64-11]
MSANPGRASTEDQRRALKAAVFRAIRFFGTAVAAAGITRVNEKRLCEYHVIQEEDRHCPVDIALDLDLAAGQPIITGALAMAQGYRLERIEARIGVGKPTFADLRRVVAEWRDVELRAIDTLEDGAISPREKKDLRKEIAELRAALDEFEAKVEAA